MSNKYDEPQLGVDNNLLELDNLLDVRNCLYQMATQTSRNIRIYSKDLEHVIYDNQEIRNALSHFARDNKYSSVCILLDDVEPIIKRGHALLDLHRRLSSSIEIRQAKATVDDKYQSFFIADKAGYIAQPLHQEKLHLANFSDQANCEYLVSRFELVWQKSYSPADIRTLPL